MTTRKTKKRKGVMGRPPVQDPTGEINLDHERARVQQLTADKIELHVKHRRRQLLETEAVRDRWNLMLSNFRARVLQLPSKVLQLIQAAASYAEAEAILKGAINECLNELADLDPDEIAKIEADEEK